MLSRKGFTLVELLVVIGIVAVLAVVVILVLNPVQLLKQGRDSNRIAELNTLNKALGIYTTDVGTSIGAANTIYVSLPDTSATCTNLGLPAPPTGWNYACVTADKLRNADGSGWIPVNFNSISFKSPLGNLPIDPVNTTTTGLYYTYAASGGRWELTAVTESSKYASSSQSDTGTDPAVYETGSLPTLTAFSHTLWPNSGDFETGTDGFGLYPGGAGAGSITNNSVYGSVVGSSAMVITAAPTLNGGGNYGGAYKTSLPALATSSKYTVSLYAKSIATPGTVVVSNQSGGGDTNCLSFTFVPTSQWRLYSKTCTLDMAKTTLYIWSNIANQQWAVDGLRVEPAN